MYIRKKIIIPLLMLYSHLLFANDINISSKDKNVVFIELFTSQGCSSCPPAEEYLNKFINNDELWTKYIPIAFHVNYWDYIGWKDIFAEAEFGARQSQYAKLKRVRTVYTPAFVVDGKAWRRSFFNRTPNVLGLKNGVLTIKTKGEKVYANFNPNGVKAKKLTMNIALLGIGMNVKIAAGENEGRQSTHSFVVLGYSRKTSDKNIWEMSLPKMKKHPQAKRYALVAWVNKAGIPTPLQAVGSWF